MKLPHRSRPGRPSPLSPGRRMLHIGTINSQPSPLHRRRPRTRRRLHRQRPDLTMGKSFHMIRLRPPQISAATTTPVHIVDHGNIVDDRRVPNIRNIIITHPRTHDMLARTKIPVPHRRPVTPERNPDIDPRPHRSPAVITLIFPPGHPGRSPLIARHPHPPIGIVIKPVPIMECRPTP